MAEPDAAGLLGATSGVSLGKGAWDCDNNCEIPPEKEVRVVYIACLLLLVQGSCSLSACVHTTSAFCCYCC